jgi:GNAT superfamily N-acetyltransferase
MPSDRIEWRRADPGDFVQIADLRWRLHTGDSEDFDLQERRRFVAEFSRSRVARDEFIHWVAVIEDRVIATMAVCKVSKLPTPREPSGAWGYLTNCYTMPEYRNKAVGSKLLAEILRWALQENLELLVVWPSERSYPFYLRSDFERRSDPLVCELTPASK